jgi:hypothetical protein
MPCTGHCFDVTPFELPPTLHEPNEQGWAASINEPIETYNYSPLHPWQTRILCLHPSQVSSIGEQPPLSADLLVANVSDIEGIVVEQSGKIVEYTALSYTWGHPALSETLICNKKRKMISSSNAAALVALRSPIELIYVWIDAICINQDDNREKSAQVARMLSIYKKAWSVTAWLGEPDTNSLLAFTCCQSQELHDTLWRDDGAVHASMCLETLRVIYIAISSLYTRPWLRRTWIRQEIFGARRLVVRCGSRQISWDQFLGATGLLGAIQDILKVETIFSEQEEARTWRLLSDARLNAEVAFGGFKSPRDLLPVLLQSQDFEVTDPRDTFYAILGMCNITASTEATTDQVQYQKDAVLVNYDKTIAEVYHDASLCIFYRKGEPVHLAGLWCSYKRSPLHDNGLPLWAVDWRSGTFGDDHQATLSSALALGALKAPLEHSLGEVDRQHTVPDDEITRVWHWPEPIGSDVRVLRLRARVLNYVAHLTSFTCEPENFVGDDARFRPCIGLTGRLIHCKRMKREPGADPTLFEPNCDWNGFELFNDEVHLWRLAILGVGGDTQLCLVPSTTQKGDLIVAIAPGLLAMVISPMQGDGTVGGLIPPDDPYETLTQGPQAVTIRIRILRIVYIASGVVIMGLNIAMIVVNEDSLAGTFFLVYYGVTLASLLVSNFVYRYLAITERSYSNRLAISCKTFSIALMGMLSAAFALFSFALSIGSTTGRKQAISAVFFGIMMATLPIGFFWTLCRKIDLNMEVALLREDVLERLNVVTQTLGDDCEFKGPVLVETYNYPWSKWQPVFFCYRWVSWCYFMSAMTIYNLTKRRPNFGRERFNWFLSEVCFIENPEMSSVWDRPIQEFRLH